MPKKQHKKKWKRVRVPAAWIKGSPGAVYIEEMILWYSVN